MGRLKSLSTLKSDLRFKNVRWQHSKVQAGHGDQKPPDKLKEKTTAIVQRKDAKPLNTEPKMTFECCAEYTGMPSRSHCKVRLLLQLSGMVLIDILQAQTFWICLSCKEPLVQGHILSLGSLCAGHDVIVTEWLKITTCASTSQVESPSSTSQIKEPKQK